MAPGIGLLGCGNISAVYLRLAPLFDGIEIRACADIDPQAAAARAAEFGLRASPVEDLLAAGDIDIVVNLTIPSAHFATSKAILEAGKHVYSEKPFVLSLDEALALTALAEGRGLRIGSAPDTFLGGTHQHARSLIDEGVVGRILSGTAHVMSRGMEGWHPNPDFFFRPGAGPILDMGPYYVTNLIQLIGPVARVTAMAATPSTSRTIGSGPRRGETVSVDTPTTVHAILEFAEGAVVTLGASWDVQSHGHGAMELYGEAGTLCLPDPNFFGGALLLSKGAEPPRPVGDWGHPLAIANEAGQANYRGIGLADMANAISEGRPHRCDHCIATHAIEVMTKILDAVEAGRALEMTTTCPRPALLTPVEARALLRVLA